MERSRGGREVKNGQGSVAGSWAGLVIEKGRSRVGIESRGRGEGRERSGKDGRLQKEMRGRER